MNITSYCKRRQSIPKMSMDSDSDSNPVEDLELLEEPEIVQLIETPNEENTNNFENQNEAGEGAPTDDADQKEAKIKRVRNPQPKLDAERLRGPRGLIVLEDIFKQVKFKGPKHEEEDLNLMLKTYEYWCHRLFPKFTFDNCLDRFEKLGTSKPVQAYIKKIRLNLLEDEKPIIDSDDDNANHDGNVNDEDDEFVHNTSATVGDDFDRLLPSPLPQPTQPNDSGELTEDQLDRIRLNREKAQQLRKQVLDSHSQLSQEQNHNTFHNGDIVEDQNSDATTYVSSEELLTYSHLKEYSSKTLVDNASNSELSKDYNFETEGDLCSSLASENVGNAKHKKSFLPDSDSEEKSQSDAVMTNVDDSSCSESLLNQPSSVRKSPADVEMHDVMSISQLENVATEPVTVQISRPDTAMHAVMSISQSQDDLDTSVCNANKNNQYFNTEIDTQDKILTNHVDTDQMSVVYGATTSQESETLPTCMSLGSERCIGSSEEMIVSEVDSPMDFDST